MRNFTITPMGDEHGKYSRLQIEGSDKFQILTRGEAKRLEDAQRLICNMGIAEWPEWPAEAVFSAEYLADTGKISRADHFDAE